MSKTIAIIDGDGIAYPCSAACEIRKVVVKHLRTGKEKVFKNRTEFKEDLKKREKEYYEEQWSFRDVQEPSNISVITALMDKQIRKIQEELFADEVVIYVSGANNFRDSLPLPLKYKDNRKDMQRPVHLALAKYHLMKHWQAVESHGMEADDWVIIRAHAEIKNGNIPIVVTVDKDANACSGLSLYDPTKAEKKVVAVPDFGSLWDTGKKITGNGFLFYCFQMLFGDPVDNYKPCSLADVKFGEKAAFKLLKDCTTEKEALAVVIKTYETWYPEEFEYLDWDGNLHKSSAKEMIKLYHQCVRMKSTEDDKLDAEEFFNRYGVIL